MTTLYYEQEDIELWAGFSGDYNPIHFEIEKARLTGSREIVVHGMLVWLAAMDGITLPPGSEWYEIRARFKRPVPSRSALSVQHSASGIVSVNDGPLSCIEGKFRPIDAQKILESAGKNYFDYPISKETIAAKSEQFKKYYPQFHSDWQILNAIIFSEFLTGILKDVLANSRMTAPTPEEMYFQTAHTIQWIHPFAISGDIHCRVWVDGPYDLPTCETGNVFIECRTDHRPVMVLNIGLLKTKAQGGMLENS